MNKRCIVCQDSLVTEGPAPILKYSDPYCHYLCQTYKEPYLNKEPQGRAPQTPEEIRERIAILLEWNRFSQEKRTSLTLSAWEYERTCKQEWRNYSNSLFAEYHCQMKALEQHFYQEEERKYRQSEGEYKKKIFRPTPFEEPIFTSTLPFPINILPEPSSKASAWEKQEFRRLNPLCKHGFIHKEAIEGKFDPCEVVHPMFDRWCCEAPKEVGPVSTRGKLSSGLQYAL